MPQKRIYSSSAQRQKAYRERRKQESPGYLMGTQLPDRSALSNVPSEKRWRVLVESALDGLSTVNDEMDDYGSERSDAWQESERGERFAERMLAITEMVAALETLIEEVFD